LAAVLLVLIFAGISWRLVWIPDLFSSEHYRVTSIHLPDGSQMEIFQYWNGGDFYTTYLRHEISGDMAYHSVIDPDGVKLWNAKIQLKETDSKADIRFGGHFVATYDYEDHLLEIFGETRSLAPNEPPAVF